MKYREKHPWLYDLLLLMALAGAGYLRFSGSDWGELQHQHPDEGFLTSVTYDIAPIGETDGLGPAPTAADQPWRAQYPETYTDCAEWGGYFDTACSPLNPHNRGKTFYTYGTLPVFMVRYLAGTINDVGSLPFLGSLNLQAHDIKLFGRQMSAGMDLLTILVLYLVSARLYGRRVALLAAAFSSLAVMQIQQSHFYTTDLFANFFILVAIFFAVSIAAGKPMAEEPAAPQALATLLKSPDLANSLLFGLAFGMAIASKLNAAPLAVLLPAAFLVREYRRGRPLSNRAMLQVTAFLVVGGLASLLAFRILQPYAFDGLGLNPAWLANIREQRAQATPNADLPWNLQWARRSDLFSFTNLTVWGLGLPLGILAWAGFLWMAWRMFKGEWRRHLLLWGWTAAYFMWQSLQYNPTMRYQLPIYPLLCMMAAWLVIWLWDKSKQITGRRTWSIVCRLTSVSAGSIVLALTAVWAIAFAGIYTRTETRIAASEWIYQNSPGPINLLVEQADGAIYRQPLPLSSGSQVASDSPYSASFTARADGLLEDIHLAHVAAAGTRDTLDLGLTVWHDPAASQPLASTQFHAYPQGSQGDIAQSLGLVEPAVLLAGQVYTLRFDLLSADGSADLCGPLTLSIQAGIQPVMQVVEALQPCIASAGQPYSVAFTAQAGGNLDTIRVEQATNLAPLAPRTLTVQVAATNDPTPDQVLASARLTSDFAVVDDPRGEPYTLTLDQPLPLLQGQALYLRLLTSGGVLTFSGSAVANETDYDYGLPFRVAGYDGFGGIYRGDLNLQVYWDDNADKLARFQSALDQADFIFIPTNHQYGQITRLPERYPLTTAYYRALLGCPQGQDIIACYRQAEPGMYQGELGFELAATFESYPSLGSWTINDQSAEEAFTFYDHPKVLIFRKTADYDPACVQAILGSVDLAGVIHMLPGQADDYKSLTLPLDRLAVQQAGGTWSQLFDYDWLQNRYPLLGLLLWYAFLLALGWAVYPLLRIALPGLADRGYPFARLAGMLLLAYLPWLAGSFEIPYSRLTIGIVFGLILLAGAGLAYTQRAELRREFKEKGVYFLVLEGFFLALLVIDLLIRIGNPDLWHPAKGGERPMNFSYFNAVLRSVTFPPYDPWFAGGYINYYYYGYVIVGTPVKLLGIVPSIAYNFILPTLFAMVGAGAFSIGYNLLYRRQPGANGSSSRPAAWLPLLGGMAASAGMVLLGNLGILRMYIWGAQRLIVPDSAAIARGNFLERTLWAIQGMIKSVMGEKLPYGAGDWYWFPSRVIPAPGDVEPITEFPLFTFLYSDLHAHMMALPLTLLVIACALSFVLALRHASHRPVRELVPALVFAALVIGALKPTNTWDLYAYLPLGALALGYALWRYWPVDGPRWGLPPGLLRPLYALLGMTVLVGLSLLLYQPFSHWFAQGYSEIDNWKGSHTPLTSYLAHWGLFLFVIVSWLAWETRQWMASTPASALGRLRPYQFWIEIGLVLLVAAALALGIMGIRIVWLALPLAAWSGILVLRPGQDEMKRAVLFLVGTALALTLVVELIVLSGDIGRMNTVFKLYYQAWTLLSISAAAAFGWLLPEFRRWTEGWRTFWLAAGGALLAIALLFTFLATSDKMRDRWVPGIPHTLDSLDYMQYASYGNYGVTMELAEDYRAIHWLQENVIGSPVIVEAAPAGVQYGWHSRMTIYTGLPGVIGWEWHQIQQRVLDSNAVRARGQEVDQFFNTTDLSLAQDFLAKYSVRYIIVGRLEWAKYTPTTEDTANGLLKFEAYEGRLWQEVYRDGQTVIYEVIPADEEAVP